MECVYLMGERCSCIRDRQRKHLSLSEYHSVAKERGYHIQSDVLADLSARLFDSTGERRVPKMHVGSLAP